MRVLKQQYKTAFVGNMTVGLLMQVICIDFIQWLRR